jgi:hypothetical protein
MMTTEEILAELLEGQRRMEARLDALTHPSATAPDAAQAKCSGCVSLHASADDLVCVHYFARKTGLQPSTITRGKAGTEAVVLRGKHPRRWLKRDVDSFARERTAHVMSLTEKTLRQLDRKRA